MDLFFEILDWILLLDLCLFWDVFGFFLVVFFEILLMILVEVLFFVLRVNCLGCFFWLLLNLVFLYLSWFFFFGNDVDLFLIFCLVFWFGLGFLFCVFDFFLLLLLVWDCLLFCFVFCFFLIVICFRLVVWMLLIFVDFCLMLYFFWWLLWLFLVVYLFIDWYFI